MRKKDEQYKVPFTPEEKKLFNTIKSQKIRSTTMGLYANLVFKAEKQIESGKDAALTFSFRPFLNTYNRGHRYLSLGSFKNRIDILISLGLLKVKKNKQTCTYYLNRFLNSSEATPDVATTNVGAGEEKHKYRSYNNILNTNNIIDQLSNAYKGVEYNTVASKKQLKKIAKALLVAYNLNSKTMHDKCVQWLVFKKLRFSNKKINLIGAVNYIKTIILDKLKEVRQDTFEVPLWLNNVNSATVNFTQREYTQEQINDLENMLLESSFVFE